MDELKILDRIEEEINTRTKEIEEMNKSLDEIMTALNIVERINAMEEDKKRRADFDEVMDKI